MFGKKPCPCGCGESLGGTRWKAMREHEENVQYLVALDDENLPMDHRAVVDLIHAGNDVNMGLEAYGHYGDSSCLPSFTERTQFQHGAARAIKRKIKL